MINLIENLERLVFENKLTKASEEVESLLAQDIVLTQELFEIVQKVFELTNQNDIKIIKEFLEKSLDNHLNIKLYLKKILNRVNEIEFYFIYPVAKKYFISNGMLEDFEAVFLRYKKNLLKNKAYTCLNKEVEEIQNLGIEIDINISEISLAHYGQGDINYFEQQYKCALTENKKTILHNVVVNFENIIWRKQSFVMKEIVLRNIGSSVIENKKELLKAIYELLLVDNETKSCLWILIEYARQMGHKDLGESIASFLVEKYNEDEQKLEKIIKKIIAVKRDDFEEIDLADDLFGGEAEPQDITIRRLVNQINILKDERDLEGATKLLEKLKCLDKDHTLVKELEEKSHKIKGSKLSKPKRTLQEIENDLLNELSIYSESEGPEIEKEEQYLNLYTKKIVELMGIEELLVQYRELIYSYNTLGFYQSSMRVIDRVLEEGGFELKNVIEVLYLKIETLRMSQNYYKALNEVESVIESRALTDSEKVSFYYLKGEVLREVGRRSDALKSYAKVYSLNSKYRMVSHRLKEIE